MKRLPLFSNGTVIRRGTGDRERVRGTRNGPAVIGHSCFCVPPNVLSVCLFVFFHEANKIKLN